MLLFMNCFFTYWNWYITSLFEQKMEDKMKEYQEAANQLDKARLVITYLVVFCGAEYIT